jgi:Flp pilus assembly protein TadG
MSTDSILARFRQTVRNFCSASRGNVAMLFGLLMIPLIGSVGAAIDYSRFNSVKVDLQGAIDSIALSLTKEAASDTNTQLQTNAATLFNSIFSRPEVTSTTVNATYSPGTANTYSTVVVNACATVPTVIMGILGYNSVNICDSSTAKWGYSRLRVALVLDNTGSMSQSGKITALKTATNNLLSQLSSAATADGDVYVSIIPFVDAVNIKNYTTYTSNTLSWVDYGKTKGSDWGCNSNPAGLGPYIFSKALCSYNGGTWTSAGGVAQAAWSGCITDRGPQSAPDSGNYDTNITAPAPAIASTLLPAVNHYACNSGSLAPAMGLSYNWSAMTSLVNNMTPEGGTNQNIGILMGWMSLAGVGPFTAPAEDPKYTYNHIIIVLSDGLNTWDRWYGDGSTHSTQVDARQALTCANIKAAGITIYTVQVNTDGEALSTILQSCATDSSKFFYMTSSTEIVTTFNSIATALANLYLAK